MAFGCTIFNALFFVVWAICCEHYPGRCIYRLHWVSDHARFASLQLDWGHHVGYIAWPPQYLCHKKMEASRQVSCPRTQQASLPACSPHSPYLLSAMQGRCTIFKVFWYDSTREMNPRSTSCEADAPTTTLLHRSDSPTHPKGLQALFKFKCNSCFVITVQLQQLLRQAFRILWHFADVA